MTSSVHVGRYKIDPGEEIHLDKIDPDDTSGFEGKSADEPDESKKLNEKLKQLQEMLYAEHRKKLLVILQAVDTGGKDGVIHRVFQGVNPQGVQVAHFGVPTPEESDHDFLWRHHKSVPGKGEIVIFNRSHYEGVLVERVHKLVPEPIWKERYEQINDFERLLIEEGAKILKFFLHIDKEEQKRRLQERLDDPTKNWKFSLSDLPERGHWSQYMSAYKDVLERTSTKRAPWYVVPSNHGWFRDLLVCTEVVRTIEVLHMHDPPLPKGVDAVMVK